MATLQAMGVLEDSPLRKPTQIPFLDTSLAVQNPPSLVDEEETTSMRELVQAIDSHVELVDLEVTGNLRAGDWFNENIQL